MNHKNIIKCHQCCSPGSIWWLVTNDIKNQPQPSILLSHLLKNGSGDLIPCFNPVNCVVSQMFVVCSMQHSDHSAHFLVSSVTSACVSIAQYASRESWVQVKLAGTVSWVISYCSGWQQLTWYFAADWNINIWILAGVSTWLCNWAKAGSDVRLSHFWLAGS